MAELPNPVLAFMAHPDDAELLCGGTLARLAEVGCAIHVATATAGDCGTMEADAWAISATRTEEARRAALMLGGTYHCLDERDGRVVYDKPTVQKAMELFRRVGPRLVLTHPREDYMMDHEMVHRLARAASFLHAAPNVSPHPPAGSAGIPHLYYCDPVEGLDPLGRPAGATTWIEVTERIERKAELLACHDSQRAWLRAHHGMDEYIEAMRRHARWRGEEAGTGYAEAFLQHRGHGYPRDDVLGTAFGVSGAREGARRD